MVVAILGVDIGGTNCRAVVSDPVTGIVLARLMVKTNRFSAVATLEALKAAANRAHWDEKFTYVSTGVAVAGNVQNGFILDAGNLSAWVGVDLVEAFSSWAGSPVVVMNDCAAAALGEYVAFRRPLVYVIWGTGVGAAVVDSRGAVLPTELGHMTISVGSKLQCGCGGYGHLEAHVGGGHLAARFGTSDAGDLSARQWSKVVTEMAAGLLSISCGNIGLPIIMGGGVIHKQAALMPLLQQEVARQPAPVAVPPLSFAAFGEDSGLRGAAEAARRLLVA